MPLPSRFRRPGIAVLLALIPIAIAWVILSRGPSSPADLASFLPNKDGTLLYIDVGAMRKAGLLGILAGSRAAEELEYKDFVQQTGFDYKHDLDAIAATFRGGQIFFVVRGNFHWDKLLAFAEKRGGSCRNSYCAVDGSKPGRRISFHKLRSNLMALAVSSDDMAAYQISNRASKVSPFTPDEPIWVMVPAAVLKEAASLPPGIRAFAMILQSADRAVFSVGPDGSNLRVSANVTCQNVESASALLVQLENTTNTLRKWLAREHQQASPNDLSGVLVAGSFRRDDRRVLGQWPLQRSFVDSIAGGSY